MDTVLIGGVSVLVFFGLVWLTHAKVEASSDVTNQQKNDQLWPDPAGYRCSDNGD